MDSIKALVCHKSTTVRDNPEHTIPAPIKPEALPVPTSAHEYHEMASSTDSDKAIFEWVLQGMHFDLSSAADAIKALISNKIAWLHGDNAAKVQAVQMFIDAEGACYKGRIFEVDGGESLADLYRNWHALAVNEFGAPPFEDFGTNPEPMFYGVAQTLPCLIIFKNIDMKHYDFVSKFHNLTKRNNQHCIVLSTRMIHAQSVQPQIDKQMLESLGVAEELPEAVQSDFLLLSLTSAFLKNHNAEELPANPDIAFFIEKASETHEAAINVLERLAVFNTSEIPLSLLVALSIDQNHLGILEDLGLISIQANVFKIPQPIMDALQTKGTDWTEKTLPLLRKIRKNLPHSFRKLSINQELYLEMIVQTIKSASDRPMKDLSAEFIVVLAELAIDAAHYYTQKSQRIELCKNISDTMSEIIQKFAPLELKKTKKSIRFDIKEAKNIVEGLSAVHPYLPHLYATLKYTSGRSYFYQKSVDAKAASKSSLTFAKALSDEIGEKTLLSVQIERNGLLFHASEEANYELAIEGYRRLREARIVLYRDYQTGEDKKLNLQEDPFQQAICLRYLFQNLILSGQEATEQELEDLKLSIRESKEAMDSNRLTYIDYLLSRGEAKAAIEALFQCEEAYSSGEAGFTDRRLKYCSLAIKARAIDSNLDAVQNWARRYREIANAYYGPHALNTFTYLPFEGNPDLDQNWSWIKDMQQLALQLHKSVYVRRASLNGEHVTITLSSKNKPTDIERAITGLNDRYTALETTHPLITAADQTLHISFKNAKELHAQIKALLQPTKKRPTPKPQEVVMSPPPEGTFKTIGKAPRLVDLQEICYKDLNTHGYLEELERFLTKECTDIEHHEIFGAHGYRLKLREAESTPSTPALLPKTESLISDDVWSDDDMDESELAEATSRHRAQAELEENRLKAFEARRSCYTGAEKVRAFQAQRKSEHGEEAKNTFLRLQGDAQLSERRTQFTTAFALNSYEAEPVALHLCEKRDAAVSSSIRDQGRAREEKDEAELEALYARIAYLETKKAARRESQIREILDERLSFLEDERSIAIFQTIRNKLLQLDIVSSSGMHTISEDSARDIMNCDQLHFKSPDLFIYHVLKHGENNRAVFFSKEGTELKFDIQEFDRIAKKYLAETKQIIQTANIVVRIAAQFFPEAHSYRFIQLKRPEERTITHLFEKERELEELKREQAEYKSMESALKYCANTKEFKEEAKRIRSIASEIKTTHIEKQIQEAKQQCLLYASTYVSIGTNVHGQAWIRTQFDKNVNLERLVNSMIANATEAERE